MSERIGQYMTAEYVEVSPKRKTTVWDVRGEDLVSIGQVRWHGAWRQYTFWPEARSVFNAGCLCDLGAFVAKLNTQHREECRARRESG